MKNSRLNRNKILSKELQLLIELKIKGNMDTTLKYYFYTFDGNDQLFYSISLDFNQKLKYENNIMELPGRF